MITGMQAMTLANCPYCKATAGNNCRTPTGRKLHHSQTHAYRFNRLILDRLEAKRKQASATKEERK